MNKKRIEIIEVAVFFGIFTVAYFYAVIRISNSFNVDYKKDLYNLKIESIEKNAAVYGKTTKDLFAKTNEVYLTVGDLATKGCVIANNDLEVIDPRDENKTLNDVKVKISKSDEEVIAEVLV